MSGLEATASELGWTFVLVLCRVMPITLIAPFLGGRFVPVSARLGLGLVLSVALLPALPIVAPPDLSGPIALAAIIDAGSLVVGEVLLGLAIGFLAALVVYAALMAGSIIDAARGGRDQARPAVLGNSATGPMATLVALLTIAVFLAAGGHQLVLRALAQSFETIGPGEVAPSVGAVTVAAEQVVALMGHMIAVAVAISLPVLLVVVLVALVLGVASRVAPRLHAFFIALPLRSLAAVFVLALSLAVAIDVLVGELGQSGGWIRRLVDSMAR